MEKESTVNGMVGGKKIESGRELNYWKTTTYRRQFCNRILTSNKHLIKLKRPLELTHTHTCFTCYM